MLTFEAFHLESSSSCENDYVEVSYDSFSQRYCGTSIPGPFTSTGSSIMVKLHSNERYHGTGFSAVWTEV